VLGLMDIGGLEAKQIKDLLKDNKKILDSTVTEVFHQYEQMIVKKQK
jgi:predicted P-loop ATPase/GTPase